MKKILVLAFSASILGLGLYGYLTQNYYIGVFLNIEKSYEIARALLILFLTTYLFFPGIRVYFTKTIMSILGVVLLSVGILNILSPESIELINVYLRVGDMFALIEGGIIALILSAELPISDTNYGYNIKKQMREFAQPNNALAKVSIGRVVTSSKTNS